MLSLFSSKDAVSKSLKTQNPMGRVFVDRADCHGPNSFEGAFKLSQLKTDLDIQTMLFDFFARADSFGLAVFDLNGRYQWVNAALAEMLGMSAETLLGQSALSVLHPDERCSVDSCSPLDDGNKLGSSADFSGVRRCVTGDGRTIWVRFECHTKFDASGVPLCLISTAVDVTEFALAQQNYEIREKRLAGIRNSDSVGIFYFNVDGTIAEPNSAFLQMLGFFEHDWFSLDLRPPSLDWRSLTPDEWRSHDEHMLVRYFETGKTVSYLKEFYRRPAMGVSHESKDDPSVVPVWISISHLDSHDEFHGVATVYDMTELFEARNLVEENRLKASLALNESNIGIWEFSPYEQRIRWDARCRYMLKLTKISDHPVDDFLEMVHPHDREALKFFDQQLPLQDNPKSRAEFRVSIKSEERIFAITSRIFDFGAGGTPIYIGTLQDVTEAKKSARLLQESEERFRTLAEVIPQIIFISDEIGQILYLNNKWFDYTGVDSKNWNTEIVYSKIHPEDVNRMMTSWNYSLENKKPFEIEYRLQSQAGEYRWFIARAVPLLDGQSKVLRWFGSSTDIHDQKRVSEQLREAKDAAIRADQMKSNFLANMSHEIRTPLGAILGFTDVLAEEHLSESERAEFLGIISRNGHTLSRIVDDILDLSKVEAGMLALENSMFEPRQEIQETVSLFGEKARQKGLALNTVFKNELPDRLNSDPTRFRQILGNLVSNAIKFTERGFVRIEVQIRGNDLEVRVCDSGIGIDSSHIAQLFKPFMQADESMNRRFGGTGLGLHLSRKLAEAMGGSLCIESSVENRGSVFLLKIPVLPNAHAHLNESAVLPVTEPSELKVQMLLQQGDSAVRDLGKNHETRSLLDGFKILIVDDSRDNQLLVERILKRKGAEVEFADNGRMGVEKALSGQFDLILMDVQMPDVDGFEATLDIRSKGLRTPVFALTAHVVDEIRVRCQEVGCDGFLSKPVRASELIEVALRFIHH